MNKYWIEITDENWCILWKKCGNAIKNKINKSQDSCEIPKFLIYFKTTVKNF